jgi:hypothetical protein
VAPDFFSYQDGVYGNTRCTAGSANTMNHALLIIGFGSDNGADYWLVQNSWGTGWGQGGFAKIARGSNTCGIASCATFPINIVDPWKQPYRNFQRHLHNISTTGAMCLDGTPAGIYYSKGYGEGANKTIVHFQGGGWCYGFTPEDVANDCYNRAQTNIGSTKNLAEVWYEGDRFPGDINFDLNFYNWNRYWIVYCDGTGHQGYLEQPVVVKNTSLYFRG